MSDLHDLDLVREETVKAVEQSGTHSGHTSVHLNLDHLSFDDFGLFFDPDTDGFAECLRECFSFGHL